MSDEESAAKAELRSNVRSESLGSDDVIVIRGGPDTAEKVLGHARRLHAVYVLDGLPVFGVSVVAALDDLGPASLDRLLADRMASYRSVYLPRAGSLIDAGFELLPTFGRPHFTALFESNTPQVIERFLNALGPEHANPYHGGRRPRRR